MSSMIVLRHAEERNDIAACFATMKELRPMLTSENELVERVARQAKAGYRILAAWQGPAVVGLAGYRILENLINGVFIYVDDLVVASTIRSQGLGARLLDGISDECRRRGIKVMTLDTAIGNSLGQRFYFRYGMLARGLHFGIRLEP
jgi:GNAT superfamily N-acetyltransferase